MGARHPTAQPVRDGSSRAPDLPADPPGRRPVRFVARGVRRGDPSSGPQNEAALIVLTVLESHNLHLPGGRLRRIDQERDRLTAGAIAIVRRARAAGVRATYLIWEGDPAEAILEASHAETCGPRSSRGRDRARICVGSILGSVSVRVTARPAVVSWSSRSSARGLRTSLRPQCAFSSSTGKGVRPPSSSCGKSAPAERGRMADARSSRSAVIHRARVTDDRPEPVQENHHEDPRCLCNPTRRYGGSRSASPRPLSKPAST